MGKGAHTSLPNQLPGWKREVGSEKKKKIIQVSFKGIFFLAEKNIFQKFTKLHQK